MPDYKKNDPVGWCGDKSRGAALGRPTITDETKDYVGKLSVRRVRLSDGGYDKNGTYFGHGQPLYWCANDESTVDFMVRAADREDAVAQVRKEYPNAKIRK
jgi:hypothetical protein